MGPTRWGSPRASAASIAAASIVGLGVWLNCTPGISRAGSDESVCAADAMISSPIP